MPDTARGARPRDDLPFVPRVRVAQRDPDGMELLVAEAPTGEEIAACAAGISPLPQVPDAGLIALGGIEQPYRGRRLPDGTRLSDFLVRELLARLEGSPVVWCLVDPANGPAQRVLLRHGFVKAGPGSPYGEELWLRPRGSPNEDR